MMLLTNFNEMGNARKSASNIAYLEKWIGKIGMDRKLFPSHFRQKKEHVNETSRKIGKRAASLFEGYTIPIFLEVFFFIYIYFIYLIKMDRKWIGSLSYPYYQSGVPHA